MIVKGKVINTVLTDLVPPEKEKEKEKKETNFIAKFKMTGHFGFLRCFEYARTIQFRPEMEKKKW